MAAAERPRVYRRPGGPASTIPSRAMIAAALLQSPVVLTRGEADEIADSLHLSLFPTTPEVP